MNDIDIQACRAAIAALEGQRTTLGDAVVEMATAPLRARLTGLLRPAGLQRRQVTVLFADVVGSTAMAQGLRAEDTLDVLSGALRRMASIIEAHQGRVLRFTGDGVKAAFGMDEAREDHAERAVRAGLAIVEAGRQVRGLFALDEQPPLLVIGIEAPMQTYLVRAALDRLNAVLDRLQRELADCPANETIALRWHSHQVLAALGGEHAQRAGPLLEQLHADVQARATAVTDAADRERLIQAIPTFRAIVAAYARRGGHGAAP